MTSADIYALMPLLILAGGILIVLLLGAVRPDAPLTMLAGATLAASAAWAAAVPSSPVVGPGPGITFGPFARFFTVLFSLAGLSALLLGSAYNRAHDIRGEEYPAALLFAAFGMAGLAGATNLLVFFLALEGLTFAFYILVAIDLHRSGSAEAGLKYLLQGGVAACFIAFGIALVYAGSGTLAIVEALRPAGSLTAAGAMFLVMGIAFKVSLVPAHLWTPDVYQGAPTPVVAFLSTGSKGAALVALLLLAAPAGRGNLFHDPLWLLALLSMVVGNLAALQQQNLKRMLAYSSIAQMGYVTLAFLTGTGDGYRATAFYIVVYTLMNLLAFGAIASLSRDGSRESVESCRGAGYSHPFAGGVLALAMVALAGIPPTGGFIGKFYLFYAALKGGETVLAVIGMVTAAVSAYYYLRVVVNLYMRPGEEAGPAGRVAPAEGGTLALCALLLLFLGLYPRPLMAICSLILP